MITNTLLAELRILRVERKTGAVGEVHPRVGLIRVRVRVRVKPAGELLRQRRKTDVRVGGAIMSGKLTHLDRCKRAHR